MYLAKRKKFDWTFVLGASDGASLLLALGAGRLLFPGVFLGDLAVYALLLAFFFTRSSLYTWRRFTARRGALRAIFSVFFRASLALYVLAALMRSSDDLLPWLAVQTVIGTALVWLGRLLCSRAMMDWLQLIPQELILVIGWTPAMEKVVESYRQEVGRFQTILGVIEMPGQPLDPALAARGVRTVGRLDEFERIAEEMRPTLLLVDETAIRPEQLHELTTVCSLCGTHLRLLPAVVHSMTRRLWIRRVAGISLIGVQGVPLDLQHNRVFKRVVDIVGALVGLLLTAPIILGAGFLIRRESPGPIFFRQQRMGRDGKAFSILKLRTMRLGADAGTYQATVLNDSRLLKVGAFLRRWNLDETPQFWNVLLGDMSLVGPRPEVVVTIDQLKRDIRHYNLRHHCKPGLTGWAAVNGFRGGQELFTERLEYDLEYYENWTPSLDFYIMFLTLLPPKNAH